MNIPDDSYLGNSLPIKLFSYSVGFHPQKALTEPRILEGFLLSATISSQLFWKIGLSFKHVFPSSASYLYELLLSTLFHFKTKQNLTKTFSQACTSC